MCVHAVCVHVCVCVFWEIGNKEIKFGCTSCHSETWVSDSNGLYD